MTPLVENVHYERIVIEPRQLVDIGGERVYCQENCDGRTVIYRATDPEVSLSQIAAFAEQERRQRLAKGRRLACREKPG